MNKDNFCLDTNTIISYLFLFEPQYNLINKFISNNPNDNYYYTENILRESEKIFIEKYNSIRSILLDFNKYLNSQHNSYNTFEYFLNQFITSNKKTYTFNGKIYTKQDIRKILTIMWYNMSTDESIDGFELQKYISSYLSKLINEIWTFKENFFNNLIFIPAHKYNYSEIIKTLKENNSHHEDNMIILDLYEYYLNKNIKFILITFDKNFYNAIQKSNLKFITQVYNLEDIK